MDYCSSCRRHLNGALVCPGCGAYAPDIAPATVDGRPVTARATVAPAVTATTWEFTASEPWHDGGPGDGAAAATGPGEPAGTGASGDLEGAPPAPRGRAARRRQLARWKKTQRRAVVATAVALVGGGLALASMERTSAGRAQAATAPDVATMGAGQKRVTEHSVPAPALPSAHPSSPAPAAQSPSGGLPSGQSAATTPRATPPSVHTDVAAPAHTAPRTSPSTAPVATVASVPQSATSSRSGGGTAAGRTGTAAQQQSTPTGSSANPGTSRTSPAPASTSPSQVCLLVVCLG